MAPRNKQMHFLPLAALVAVIVIGFVVAVYVTRAPSTVTLPPNREGTQNTLPAAPGSREALPGTPQPPANP
jgi:hypothetical protein